MSGSMWLAWRYISYHRGRTIILLLALTLTIFLPLVMRWVAQSFENYASRRAQTTPLVIGTQGSRFGLTLHSLYFLGEAPEVIPYAELQKVEAMQLAKVIPLHARFRTRGVPLVGTSEDYFNHRQLGLASGSPLKRYGDCVVGARVAEKLGIQAGDRLLTEPENLFDLSGPAPLNLRVTGILAPAGNADDEVVFCDLRTAWIIEGIGHGHTVSDDQDSSDHRHAASSEYLQGYQEVTEDNLNSFHFHGRRSEYPLTALIAIPESEKAETLLLGKYLDPGQRCQIIRPIEVVQELMQVVSRIRSLFTWAWSLLAFSTFALVGLVTMLSLRLRQSEIRTMHLLGCGRGTIFRLIGTELCMMLSLSVALAVALALLVSRISDQILVRLL
jgi:putative ABC transport system permease protein